jgi:hypothetical protein
MSADEEVKSNEACVSENDGVRTRGGINMRRREEKRGGEKRGEMVEACVDKI